VPNRATVERALLAERQVAESKANGNPLAKEVLEAAMLASMKMAEHYTPTPAMPDGRENINGREDEFMRWLRVTIDCATKLAPYQSPALRAIYLETKDLKSAVVGPKTQDDIFAQVEKKAGLEGRVAFEQFLTKIRHLEEARQKMDPDNE
jgi:hypothetical protein